MNKVGDLIAGNGVFFGLLALAVSVPIIASPYTQSNVFLIKTVVFQSLVFCLFIFWLAGRFLKRELFNRIPLTVQWLSLLGVGLLTFAFSPYRYAALEEFLRFLSFFLLYVLIVEEVSTERRQTLITEVLALVTIIVCLYGILQGADLHLFAWERRDLARVMSSFGNPNFFGTYLVALTPLLLALSLSPGARRRILASVASTLALICLVLAGTRSAWIGLAVSLVVFFLLLRKTWASRLRLKGKGPLLIILLLVLVVVALNLDAIVDRISELGDTAGSAYYRMHIWKATFGMIKASPVFGAGLGTFQITFPEFRYPGFAAEVPIGNLLHAHNEYLEIWAETGLLGLGVFLWLMVSLFVYTLKQLNSRKENGLVVVGLLCGAAGVLADSLFSASMRWTGPAFAFWLVFSLAVSVATPEEGSLRKERRKRRSKLTHVVVISACLLAAAVIARWHVRKYRANVHMGRAQALLDGGLRSQALLELRQAQRANPVCLPATYLLGCLHIKEGDFQEAKRSFERLERLAPDYANSHEWKGYLYFRLGDLSRAEEEFKLCIRQKGSVFRHNMLGRIYSVQKKWDQAQAQLEQSVRVGAGIRKSPAQAAAFSAEDGMEPPVELGSDAGVQPSSAFEESELANAHIMLARVHYQKEEHEKSIQQMREVGQESLDKRQAGIIAGLMNDIAWEYAKKGENLEAALDLCDRALRLNPLQPELIHDTKAWIYLKKGRLKEAQVEIERALEIAPEDPVLRQDLEMIRQLSDIKPKDIDLEEIR